MASKAPLLPGAAIGILGSGQLGRMLALEARKMGFRVHVLSPAADTPAGQVAEREWVAPYDDLATVQAFARAVGVVTFEFENVPAATVEAAAAGAPVHPGGWVLETAQNRVREKQWLHGAGLPVTPFVSVTSVAALDAAVQALGCPVVLKTAAWGYDGKGQARIDAPEQAAAAWQQIGARAAIVERLVPFERELSVVAARGADGSFAHYGAIENIHHHHILDLSIAPARVPDTIAARAVAITQQLLERLEVVGVLCVEFFLTGDGELLINEIAPRPHNSGHLTFGGAVTSQFEQQLRAVCGLPLGSTRLHAPLAMANLLGDLWADGEPNWPAALALPGVSLHLYGKQEARPGRKMGHLTVAGESADDALARAIEARAALTASAPTGR